jgi:glycosyltransferase involved in cell wall biosynthesis
MIKDCLVESDEYTLDYFETDPRLVQFYANTGGKYDFYIINWHPHTLAITNKYLDKLSAKIAIVLEVSPNEYAPMTPNRFDAYAIIDPTKERTANYFPLPRPVLQLPTKPLLDDSKLVLGSFGLYNKQFKNEKRFDEIVESANNSGRDCIVRINLPVASFTYTSLDEIKKYGDWLKSLAKPNVDIIITHDYMSREELVGWLSEHTMNCFPYYRERAGLSAVTDQAVSAGRAIMTTECNTFRHIHKYINHFPKESYEELSISTLTGVKKMQEDWSPENFRKGFNNMLREMKIA